MANDRQVEIIKSGVEAWNRWREENPQAEIDLRGADLAFARLEQANLFGAHLEEADLSDARLTGANLEGARLVGAKLEKVRLEKARMAAADFTGANLVGANLEFSVCERTVFTDADLSDARLTGCDFSESLMTRAILHSATLDKANLWFADLTEAVLFNVQMEDALLSGANLARTMFSGGVLDRCDLSKSSLEDANLSFASLVGALVSGADLRRAHLRFTILEHAALEKVRFDRFGIPAFLAAVVRRPLRLPSLAVSLLLGTRMRCRGVRASTSHGSPRFRLFLSDQDYLEEMIERPAGVLAALLWWLMADCGRSLARWVAWCAAIVFFFAWAYAGLGPGNFVALTDQSFAIYLSYSASVFSGLGLGHLAPNSAAANHLTVAETLLGLVMLAGLVAIFFRRLARRG